LQAWVLIIVALSPFDVIIFVALSLFDVIMFVNCTDRNKLQSTTQ